MVGDIVLVPLIALALGVKVGVAVRVRVGVTVGVVVCVQVEVGVAAVKARGQANKAVTKKDLAIMAVPPPLGCHSFRPWGGRYISWLAK